MHGYYWQVEGEEILYTSLIGCIKNAGLFERIGKNTQIGFEAFEQEVILYQTNNNLCTIAFDLGGESTALFDSAKDAAICVDTLTDETEQDGRGFGYWRDMNESFELDPTVLKIGWVWVNQIIAIPMSRRPYPQPSSDEDCSSVDWVKEGF